VKLSILVFATVALLSLGRVARADDATEEKRQAQYKTNRDALLKEEWLKKADWITDYDKARAEAKKSGKTIFGYFTRSYAT
jgi:hypothetical protein